MNYLGHAYFSFNHPEILVGNLISDFVKGKRKYDYPDGVQKGMQLHRDLDAFSDNHEATRRAKEIFRPQYRLYAGAFMDVVYDYFIANDTGLYSEKSLHELTQHWYTLLDERQHLFPSKFALMFPYMKSQNWLYNYRYPQGIDKSFGGLAKRASYLTESVIAFRLFEDNLGKLQECYNSFAPEIKLFAKKRFDELVIG